MCDNKIPFPPLPPVPHQLLYPTEVVMGFWVRVVPFRGRQQHMQLTLHRKPSATLCPGPSYLPFRTQLRGQLFWEAEPDPTKLARWFPVCINHQVLKVPTHSAVCPGWLTESGDCTVCLNPIHPAQGLVQTRHTNVYYVNNWINECTNMTTIIMTFPVIKHQLYLISSVICTENQHVCFPSCVP